MATLNKYGLSSTAFEEWVPWGGIVVPFIMREKDGSMFSVIRYQPYTIERGSEQIDYPFRRGWVLWHEHQHTASTETPSEYLVVCWNPFIVKSSSYVQNALHDKIQIRETIDGFEKEIKLFLSELQKYTEAELLEYQELMDFLSFTVSFGEDHAEMPDIPLYMDALLTQNIDFKFGTNDIYINDKRLLVISATTPPPVAEFYSTLDDLTFRHVQRIELFSNKEATKDLRKYTSKWFPNRKIIRELALAGILGKYNGYYSEVFLFLVDTDDYEAVKSRVIGLFEDAECSYILESYNLKEVFWGTLSGLYLANARPPLVGFESLAEFLGATITEKIVPQIELAPRVQSETEKMLQSQLEEETNVPT